MKNKISIFIIVVMTAVLVFAVPVFGAEPQYEKGGVFNKSMSSGYSLDFKNSSNVIPQAVDAAVQNVYAKTNVASMELSFTGQNGKSYMIYLLKPVNGGESTVPADGNIAYVSAATGNSSNGAVSCKIYPTGLSEDGVYNIMVSGPGLGSQGAGAIVKAGSFKVGDYVKVKGTQEGLSVRMSGYSYGKTPSKPSISGSIKDSAKVTYYYSTSNVKTGGTEWKNISSRTLSAGTYYMYAVVSATDKYELFTTEPVQFEVGEQTSDGGIFSIFTELIQSIIDLISSLFSSLFGFLG